MAAPSRAAVFLDRDGVLNEDLGYVHRVEDLRLLSGVPEALIELRRRGYLLLVVTNQSGVARGHFGLDDVERFHAAVAAELARSGAGLDGFYVCPHLPDGAVARYRQTCDCRKPAPGLVLRAASEHGVDLTRSFLVGDKPDDIECAVRAGVTGIQVAAAGRPRHQAALALVPSLAAALAIIPASSSTTA